MRIENIKGYTYNAYDIKRQGQRINTGKTSPAFSSVKVKQNIFQRLKNFLHSKLSPQHQSYVKEVRTNIANILPTTRPLEAKSQKDALNFFVSNENFSKKVEVKNSKDGSTEIFSRMFDPVSHDMRINADYIDIKGKLHHTTVYDNNGLKLSQYFVKVNNPKEPISIRRKDFDVNGKIVREEIKYKNGDITYVDYDYIYKTQTFKNVSKDGSYNIVVNTPYSSEIQYFDKTGKQIG